jgi:hypothetical protein
MSKLEQLLKEHEEFETIFKLLVAKLIVKASDLFKQMNQKPMMSDNFLMSVVFIDFERAKPKKELSTNIFIQIMLLYAVGWLQETLDEIKDENEKNQNIFYLICLFYLYLVGSKVHINNDAHFELLLTDVINLISDDSIDEKKRQLLKQMGRWSAECDKGENGIETSLALILNEWMQFKGLK